MIEKQNIMKLVSQVWKFGLVGFLNTGVDFLITNLLFWFFKPANMFGLMLISIFAILAAAVNSYFLNKFWTFDKKTSMKIGEVYRFAIVTFMGMVVNTSIFLFASKYLRELFSIDGFINLNVARLIGVGAAMGVTFLGYRFGVFDTEGVNDFRESFAFEPDDTRIEWRILLTLISTALLLRLLFVWIAPVAYGDAVNYNWNAYFMTHGMIDSVDWFWHSMFTYWEALLFLCGLSRYAELVLSSLVPGILLLIPLYAIAKSLFGARVALFATLATVFHPRMVEYSVNGYSATFVILFLLCAVWGMVRILRNATDSPFKFAILAGVSSAFCFITRNEIIIIAALFCLLLFSNAIGTRKFKTLAWFLTAFVTVSLLFVCLNYKIAGTSGIFQKTSNFTKRYSEQLDLEHSAKEVYGVKRSGNERKANLADTVMILIKRYPRNILYSGERLPGILLSPLILFIPFLWLMTKRGKTTSKASTPVWIATIFPVVFYPLFQVEPRYFFFGLPTMQIFGVAGATAFVLCVTRNLKFPWITSFFLSALTILAFIPLIFIVAWNSESTRGYHREVGYWIKENMPPDTAIAGDGYGYCNTFWSGIPKKHSRIWTTSPKELCRDTLSHGCDLLIINEEFLRKANKDLLGVLDNGIPGMELIKQFKFDRVGRVQIYSPLKIVDPVKSKLKTN